MKLESGLLLFVYFHAGFAFLCPNGTLFNQKYFVCDWYKNVDCLQSEQYYSRNDEIGKNMGSLSDLMEVVQRMLDFTQPSSDANKPAQSPFNLGQFNKASNSNNGLRNPQSGLPKSQDSIPNFEINNFANGNSIYLLKLFQIMYTHTFPFSHP